MSKQLLGLSLSWGGCRLIGIVSSYAAAVSSDRCFFIWWPAADAAFEEKAVKWNFQHLLDSPDLARLALQEPLALALDALRGSAVQMPPPSKSAVIRTNYTDVSQKPLAASAIMISVCFSAFF